MEKKESLPVPARAVELASTFVPVMFDILVLPMEPLAEGSAASPMPIRVLVKKARVAAATHRCIPSRLNRFTRLECCRLLYAAYSREQAGEHVLFESQRDSFVMYVSIGFPHTWHR